MAKQNTILIVDDAEVNRAILRNLFEADYNIIEAENGQQAMVLLQEFKSSIAAILLDLVMPLKDGYEIMVDMARDEQLAAIPIIVITSDDSKDSKVKVFSLGASDIITKPFEPDVVKSRVRNIVELNSHRRNLEELVAEQSDSLRESNSIVVDMLSSVIEYRSLESGQHIRRIRLFTKILLEDASRSYKEYELTPEKIQFVTDASSMHDIGKIAIPDIILNKPGKLTPEEFEIMQTHSLKGCEILSGLTRMPDKEYLKYAYNICRYHHERWDGNGYPDGLKGDSIPICAQVVSIADCYDALTTDRSYRKALPRDRAFNMILNGECGSFSPKLLESFKNVRSQFEELSQKYADGLAPTLNKEDQTLPPIAMDSVAENTLAQGQMKYFTLLRYADSTVMEVDLNTGMYHLVYLADKDFEGLRAGDCFEKAIKNFTKNSVHPEDQPMVLDILDKHMQTFFDNGLMQSSRRYRVLCRKTGEYYWCQGTMLRMNVENPYQRKIMLVWHKDNQNNQEPTPIAQSVDTNIQHSNIMNQLLGGIQKCAFDQYLTMVHINQGFIEMLGYTEHEIQTDFGSRFIDFVYPSDRDKIFSQVKDQLNSGKTIELEYRLVAKDGHLVWVIDRSTLVVENGLEYLYCVLVEITKSKQAEEELRRSLERHRIIMEQTNDIIFEWDIEKDELRLPSKWEKKYGYLPITKCVSIDIPKYSHLNPDDIPAFKSLTTAMSSGVPYKETELRMLDKDGQYRWSKIRATAQFDENGKPYKAVGIIMDIDSEKRAAAELEAKAKRDMLTKLYNKETGRLQIEQLLKLQSANQLSALMVIDVDNFKQINDNYGHMFGDAVLTEVASKISSLFRTQDIISRIGGDEFIVFMPTIPSQVIAKKRAEDIIESIQNMLRENLQDTNLSCSIGLAYLKGANGKYQTLFGQADRALYRAKDAGKNCYITYTPDMSKPDAFAQNDLQAVRTQIDSDQMPESNMTNFINATFEILYKNKNLDQAIQAIIAMIGQLFNVSRVYIFENTADNQYCNNTFEWCNNGVNPEKVKLQNIAYDFFGKDYRQNFNENDIFYCPDVQKLPDGQRDFLAAQGIRALLQCAIKDEGQFRGFVGLDDCSVQRLWTKEQIDALVFVGKVISTLLLKQQMHDALL